MYESFKRQKFSEITEKQTIGVKSSVNYLEIY